MIVNGDFVPSMGLQSLLDSWPEYQEARAASLEDGWQRYVTLGVRKTETGSEAIHIPVLTPRLVSDVYGN